MISPSSPFLTVPLSLRNKIFRTFVSFILVPLADGLKDSSGLLYVLFPVFEMLS